MARKRRRTEVFSMSFLDCMSCGFGAVILFFMIINAQVTHDVDSPPERLLAETNRLEYEILEKRKDMVLARNTMEELQDEQARADSEIARITALVEKLKIELAKHDNETLAKIERVEKLQSDIRSLEEERKRIMALEQEKQQEGNRVRTYTGDGDRQYLTGLRVGGKRIMILVDSSASMLDHRVVNIIRRRILDDAQKLKSPKWRQVVASVDWLSAQLPVDAQFQIYTFNTTTRPVLDGTDGLWIDVGDGTQLNEAIRILRRTVPQNGTNMLDAFRKIGEMNPPPDNVILLVDGLPTMNAPDTERGMVTGQERLNYYYEAESELSGRVPINVLLYPMEGDYQAAIVYWILAFGTGGSFIGVSEDWP